MIDPRQNQIRSKARRLAAALVLGPGAVLLLTTAVTRPVPLHAAPRPSADNLPADTAPVTFNRDIAPLVHAHCAACHREGEAAPFALLTYADVRRHAKRIAEVTGRRVMPPWKAEHGFGDFLGERRLGDGQIDLLKRWADAG